MPSSAHIVILQKGSASLQAGFIIFFYPLCNARPPGRMGAHQCERELSRGSSCPPACCCCCTLPQPRSPTKASDSSERERHGCVVVLSHHLFQLSSLFVPGSASVSSDHSHRLLSLHVKGMHNNSAEFRLYLTAGSMDECYSLTGIIMSIINDKTEPKKSK